MKKAVLRLLLFAGLALMPLYASAQGKLIALDFQLDDRTDLPNAPEELARIAHLTASFRQGLVDHGIALVPAGEKLKTVMAAQSPTYLFDRAEYAAELADDGTADFLLIAVALKPTYLFVYPRILLVDIKTRKVVLAKAAQLESSWSDANTTTRTGEKLAEMVAAKLQEVAEGTR